MNQMLSLKKDNESLPKYIMFLVHYCKEMLAWNGESDSIKQNLQNLIHKALKSNEQVRSRLNILEYETLMRDLLQFIFKYFQLEDFYSYFKHTSVFTYFTKHVQDFFSLQPAPKAHLA
mmetsp:Transcript_10057/g.9997  ORF Transcript_10057/g.9997 Transcript_10057/m.9997 type:complete len:118 (+) Transcript_10057:291-644(+)